MRLPCEICVRRLVPAIKRELVLELHKRYHIPQAEIARNLDITRGPVTQYITRLRAKNSYKIRKSKKTSKLIKKLAKDLAEKNISKEKLTRRFCDICKLNQKLIIQKCFNL
ncbi:MAG: winged helix-turn-helix transcriptional regulator [Nanoarchaeota archaeon]|nr:winged helix-turn-helix transcriptional regulator [Nanoarchaeota archaeon]